MNAWRKITLLLREIGLPNMAAYSLYQLQLRSGLLRRRTPTSAEMPKIGNGHAELFAPNWQSWSKIGLQETAESTGKSLLDGFFFPFGGGQQLLYFKPATGQLKHWTEYGNEVDGIDIKTIWEPARFLWSLDLSRLYLLTRNDHYAEMFWKNVEEFLSSNPANSGPNWASAQEIAIRVVMWVIALGAMKDSSASTAERLSMITGAIHQHLERIPLTLNYARSQNNNHVLSESLALMIGGEFLRGFTQKAENWITLGEHEFERAILTQVDDQGIYSQHSANYHRMMLQLSLLYESRNHRIGRQTPKPVQEKLKLATRWLIAQLDPVSGRLPNLGHNDGTLLLPLGSAEYRDYRPTAQASALAFLGTPCLPRGEWDELSDWLGLSQAEGLTPDHEINSPAVHRVGAGTMWGTLRGVRFTGRPAHCDQLHVDLWWEGINIAADAGTFSYNAPPPWQNALDSTRVHNTVMLDNTEQMHRVSRFLWLDQAQAEWEQRDNENLLKAWHDGYRKLGIVHHRGLQFKSGSGFVISDEIKNMNDGPTTHKAVIHWLLPDWVWELRGEHLVLQYKGKKITLELAAVQEGKAIKADDVSLIRGGQLLAGTRSDEILGWASDTYGEKHPVLSFSATYPVSNSLLLTTTWELINE